MGADKLIFLTDTDGILVDSHNQSTRIASAWTWPGPRSLWTAASSPAA
ncbi:MAG: hypothetical protein ACLUNZ_01700 [Evtepia sp.]